MSNAAKNPVHSTDNGNKKAASSPSAPEATSSSSEAELAQAFRELARGEQQAAAMEANLSKLESKLDAMLAQFEAATSGGTGDGVAGNDKPDENKKNAPS